MLLKEKIIARLEDLFKEQSYLFLVACSVGANNDVEIIIDGDQGVKVDDCMHVNRIVQDFLEELDLDCSLQVMSAGVSEGLKFIRQYKKNIGRKLEVFTKDNKIEGTLIEVNDKNNNIVLEWKAREPKTIGKGKVTVVKQADIAFRDIVNAKVMITF